MTLKTRRLSPTLAACTLCAPAAILLVARALQRPPTAGAVPAATPLSAVAATTEPAGAARPADFSLTIYSTADPATFSPQDALLNQQNGYGGAGGVVLTPGYGVVREVRRMNLAAGANRLEFADVAAGIDPTTVAFRSLTAPDTTNVLEQNFEFDLTDSSKLLNKYLGKEVVLVLRQPGQRRPDPADDVVRGRLLSYEGGGGVPTYVVQTADASRPVVIQRGEEVASVRLADAGPGLVSRPTLNWKVSAEKPGPHDVQVTYQTDGLTWRADYNVVLGRDDSTADLSAWVTVLNGSGLAYPDAKLKLVAGNVQRFESERRQQRYGGGFGGGTLFGGAAQENKGFEEKGFFEYHLYTLGRPTTLPNNSTKQIELFPPRTGIAVEKVFVYYGLSAKERYATVASPNVDRSFGTQSNTEVDVYARFKNSEQNHLGIPLPAGRMRLYKVDDADGNREFVGEDVIRHTPKDEPVLVRLGSAFDLVGQRVQTDFAEENGNTIIEKIEITLHNHRKEPARVIASENLYRWVNWQITESSDKWEKQDYRTVHFPVDVPAGGEKKVTYTVKYWW